MHISTMRGGYMFGIIVLVILIAIGLPKILQACFNTWADMDYIRYLEETGEFVDEFGNEI